MKTVFLKYGMNEGRLNPSASTQNSYAPPFFKGRCASLIRTQEKFLENGPLPLKKGGVMAYGAKAEGFTMKKLFLNIFLLLAVAVSAQKQNLQALCVKMDEGFSAKSGLHIEYVMTMQGRDAAEKESMNISYFKDGASSYKMVMGNIQEILCKGKTALLVNHDEKSIMVQEDTTNGVGSQTLLFDLKALIDSANSVTEVKGKDGISYVLQFTNHPTYSVMKLKFDAKTHSLKSIYAEFRSDYPEPYFSLTVDYKLWDDKWKAEANFPNMKNYVEEKNGKYVASALMTGYKVFKPEAATINLDVSKW
ncbi:MAG: hypothetical protein NT150_01875 [Bacteroidetes bacterium]|nr:hypothetical protein [Bacteroidota bacterium]